MAKTKQTYTESIKELEKILSDLESNQEINMEKIAEMVKRAATLLETCKNQLHVIDADLEKILEKLE